MSRMVKSYVEISNADSHKDWRNVHDIRRDICRGGLALERLPAEYSLVVTDQHVTNDLCTSDQHSQQSDVHEEVNHHENAGRVQAMPDQEFVELADEERNEGYLEQTVRG